MIDTLLLDAILKAGTGVTVTGIVVTIFVLLAKGKLVQGNILRLILEDRDQWKKTALELMELVRIQGTTIKKLETLAEALQKFLDAYPAPEEGGDAKTKDEGEEDAI